MAGQAEQGKRWVGRFHVERLPAVGEDFRLTGAEGAHAAGSRRARIGDRLTLFDGSGRDVECVVRDVSRRIVGVTGEEASEPGPPLPVPVTCVTALPKGSRCDIIAAQCAQLGVARLVPVEFSRSVARPAGSRRKRRDRFRRLALEAAKQSGASTIMEIGEPLTLPDFLAEAGASGGLILAGDPEAVEALPDFMAARWPFDALTFIVGPEGGFDAAERGLLERSGVVPVRIACTTLRIETACTAFAAVAAAFLCGRA